MVDNVAVTAGTGTTIAADEVVDGTLGTVKVQFVKLMDGTLDGTTKAAVGANGLKVDPAAAWDKGAGTGGTATQRVILDSASQTTPGQAAIANSLPVVIGTEQSFAGQNQSSASKQSFLVGGQFNTTPTTITTGNISPLQLDAAANLKVNSVVAQASTTSGQLGTLIQGAVTTGAPTYTTAQTSALSLTTAGALRVDNSAQTQPVSGSISMVPQTSGGMTVSSYLIASGTNATLPKNAVGQLYAIEITNNSANIGYLKLYDTGTTPTAGSGTPKIRLMVPANASGAGIVRSWDNGIPFASGIGFTFTGGIADADTTSVAASAFIVNLYYK